MKYIYSFVTALCLLIVVSGITYGQRQLGSRRLILDNNDGVAANSVFFVNNGGSLGIDNSGSVVPGTYPSNCALLDLSSNSKGFLPPRMNNGAMLGICGGAPPAGLMVYNTSTNSLYFFNGATWTPTAGAAWLIAGNSLTGGTPSTPNEFFGSVNNFDVVFRSTNVERVRILSSGGLISRVNGIGAYTGPSSGVVGLTNATSGAGIVGLNGLTNASGSLDGGLAVGQGIYGETIKDAAAGVEGVNSGASGYGFGVIGGVTSGATIQAGVLGISATNTGAQNYGVIGEYTTGGIGNPAPTTTITNAAVIGVSTVAAGFGVGADNTAAGGTGLRAQANGGGNVTAVSATATTNAGNIAMAGSFTAAGGGNNITGLSTSATTGTVSNIGVDASASGTGSIGVRVGTGATPITGISVTNATTTGVNIAGAPTSINANGTIQTTGDVKLGATLLQAPAGAERLFVMSGIVAGGVVPTIVSGQGFTIGRTGVGLYTVTTTAPLGSITFPAMTVTCWSNGAPNPPLTANFTLETTAGTTTWNISIYDRTGALVDPGDFAFTIIGPR